MPPAAPFDVEIHEMELCNVLKAQEEGAGDGRKLLSETAMDEAHPDDEEEEVEEKGQNGNQDMPAEEQRATSEAVKENESRMTHWEGGQRWWTLSWTFYADMQKICTFKVFVRKTSLHRV